jgi:hypothetical protein
LKPFFEFYTIILDFSKESSSDEKTKKKSAYVPKRRMKALGKR